MPHIHRHHYLLSFLDAFSGWLEAFPTTSEKPSTVAYALLHHIIPRFGLLSTIQQDNGPSFTSQITQQVATSLDSQWRLHTCIVPNLLERSKGLPSTYFKTPTTHKSQLTTPSLEAHQDWSSLLPIALSTSVRAPRS